MFCCCWVVSSWSDFGPTKTAEHDRYACACSEMGIRSFWLVDMAPLWGLLKQAILPYTFYWFSYTVLWAHCWKPGYIQTSMYIWVSFFPKHGLFGGTHKTMANPLEYLDPLEPWIATLGHSKKDKSEVRRMLRYFKPSIKLVCSIHIAGMHQYQG